jgi:DNA-binding Lrp family transcriptional regulator
LTLTQRRKEFLIKIKQLYKKNNAPVHYITVAEKLGVSKWSAYEMLKELEKKGFLAAKYIVDQEKKNPGRSMVFFIPTKITEEVLSKKEQLSNQLEEWHRTKEYLLQMFKNLEKPGPQKVIDELLEKMSAIEMPIILSAYIITFLIVCLKIFSSKSIQFIKKHVLFTSKPEIALSMFAGTVLGNILKTAANFNLIDQLTAYIKQFQNSIDEINFQEKTLLMDFLKEALEVTS